MKNVLVFLAGAGVGAGVTWYFVKKHYEKKADDEIKDVVTRFKAYRDSLEDKIQTAPDENPNPNYEGNSRRNNVVSMERPVQSDSDEELSNGIIDDPKGEKEATDEDIEVEDKFTTVGDALEEFKKDRYIERVLVRNEQDETDYEILISEKHFYEVTGGDTE